MRRTRSSVEDRWHKTIKKADGSTELVPSATHGKGKRYRARYVDDQGRENAKHFDLKREAQQWLNTQMSTVVTGTHVAPRDAQTTVRQWCETWLDGYGSKRPGTVRSARDHIRLINIEFGNKTLAELRPSHIKSWTARLKSDGLAASTIYETHKRLKQILGDAQQDGLLGRNPCSRATSPEGAKQKPYCATTEQVWALLDEMPEHLQVAVLLGAFVGLRVSEVAGLRVEDVNFMTGVVFPKVQWGETLTEPLKSKCSSAPIPIPQDLALLLSASVAKYGTDMMVTNGKGKPCPPWAIERAVRKIRDSGVIKDLPAKFVFQDLRHHFASLLIASGCDVKTVQARLRHASAKTTLDTYSHLWPDADASTRTAVGNVIKLRTKTADALRTEGSS